MTRASDRGFLALLIIQSSKMLPLLISNMSLATSESAALRNFADTWSGKPLHMLPSSYTANPTLQHSLPTLQKTTGSISASQPGYCKALLLSPKGGKKKEERRKLDTGHGAMVFTQDGVCHQSSGKYMSQSPTSLPVTLEGNRIHEHQSPEGFIQMLKHRLCFCPELDEMS